ncbi:MAG TPA: hypothetical protein VL126_07800 [Bacteroidota bacterium]|nr:hypothetical protein [Bacteroidota bacterium]
MLPVKPRLVSRGVRVAALFYGGATLICTQVPLLNYLGYEFSALVAFLSVWVSGELTIRTAAEQDVSTPSEANPSAFAALAAAAFVNVALLCVPLVIMAANAVFVRNCSLAEGLGYFGVLAPVSAIFGTSLAIFLSALVSRPRLAFNLVCGGLLLYSLALGYYTPAVFSYNFLYGYFPGLTYDESLPLTGTLVLFRAVTLFVAFALAWMGIVLMQHSPSSATGVRARVRAWAELMIAPGHRAVFATFIVILTVLYLFRCELGFESTAGYIRSSLGGSYRTDHFVLYYSPSTFTEEQIRQVGEEHEFRLHQILDAFALSDRGRYESFIYPSAEAKRRFTGAGNTDIAKPWSGEIHISKQSLDASLKHELVHVAAAPFGFPVIRASLSTGLVEGLAMALDPEWGNRSIHEYASALRASGAAPDIRGLMSIWGFASHASSVSYVLAGSFCRYLIDRYGIRRFMQLYRSLDFQNVYGRLLQQLVLEWQSFLDRIPPDDADQDVVDALFRRPSIFRKVCARVLAERTMTARQAFARKEYAVAESLYARAYSEGHGYEAFAGYLTSALRLGQNAVLTTALDTVVLKDAHPARYLTLFLAIGDAFWSEGNGQKAHALYERVYDADISESFTEAAAIRLLAMDEDPRGGRFLPLLLSDAADSARIVSADSLIRLTPRNQILAYLKGRMLMMSGKFADAEPILQNVDFADVDASLESLRRRFVGEACFRVHRYEEARAAFWTSLDAEDTQSAEDKVNAWIDRCEWMQRHGH